VQAREGLAGPDDGDVARAAARPGLDYYRVGPGLKIRGLVEAFGPGDPHYPGTALRQGKRVKGYVQRLIGSEQQLYASPGEVVACPAQRTELRIDRGNEHVHAHSETAGQCGI